jgi:fermentation-respiration switch protein FrsA (DUF1100 family)
MAENVAVSACMKMDHQFAMNAKAMNKSMWSRIGIIACWAVGVLSLIVYVAGGLLIHDSNFADQTVLCPDLYNDTYDISLPGIKRQSFTIPTDDGQTLDAWLFLVPKATRLVIVNHGNAGNLSSRGFVVQALTQAGTSVLIYDYRGYGKSTGRATLHGILDDGQTVYAYARSKLGYPANKIIEYGESIGTAAACRVAAKENCGALMLFAPLDSLPSAGKWTLPILQIYPDFCFAEQLNNLELIKKIHSPIFIIHGKNDQTLRVQGSERLYDAASQPKTIVYLPDSSHTEMSADDGALYMKSIAQFIATLRDSNNPRVKRPLRS